MYDNVAVFDAIGGKLPISIWEMKDCPLGTYINLRMLLEQNFRTDTRVKDNRVSITIRDYFSPLEVLEDSPYAPNVVKYQS